MPFLDLLTISAIISTWTLLGDLWNILCLLYSEADPIFHMYKSVDFISFYLNVPLDQIISFS